MALKTPEEIQKLKDILGAQAPAVPVTPPEQITDHLTNTPVAAAVTPPVAAPTVAPLNPGAAAKPYNDQAQAYNTQAVTMRTQAMQPQEEPQGAQQTIAAGLRNAMENMGRYGAPGGYYGQQDQRDQDYMKQQAMRLGQAKEMQDQADKQQQMGISAENVAREENYNQGQLAETTRQRQTQEAAQAETVRHNNEVEQQGKFGHGANGQIYNTKTGEVTREATATSKLQKQGGTLDGEPFFANYDAPNGKYYSPESGQDISGRFKPFVPGSGSPQDQVVQSHDQYQVLHKKTATATPVKDVNGDPLAIEDTAQERNRMKQAKIIDNYSNHILALIDKDPSAVGPLLGRISRGEIKLGDAPPNVRSLYTGLSSFEALQPILHGFRGGSQTVDHFHQAIGGLETNAEGLKASIGEIKYLAQQIRDGLDTADAPGTGAPTGGGANSVPAVGGTFNGGKVLKVTKIP